MTRRADSTTANEASDQVATSPAPPLGFALASSVAVTLLAVVAFLALPVADGDDPTQIAPPSAQLPVDIVVTTTPLGTAAALASQPVAGLVHEVSPIPTGTTLAPTEPTNP